MNSLLKVGSLLSCRWPREYELTGILEVSCLTISCMSFLFFDLNYSTDFVYILWFLFFFMGLLSVLMSDSWDLFVSAYFVLSQFVWFCFSLLYFYYCPLDTCLFLVKRQKGNRSGCKGKKGTGIVHGKETIIRMH